MAHKYRLLGSQDPASRVDKVLVESPSEDFPDGKALILDGPPVELSDDQVSKLSSFVRLEVSSDQDVVEPLVDQPGVLRSSMSTDNPPDPGTTPDIDALTKDELVVEVERVRAANPQALGDVSSRSNKEELQQALRNHYGQGS